jgi:hypothetical protein
VLVRAHGPCNLSFDHGATYDYCRVTLVFDITEGDVEGTDIEDVVPFGSEGDRPVRFDGMFHPVASDLTMAEAKRSRIDAFGVRFEGKTGLSKSGFAWAA